MRKLNKNEIDYLKEQENNKKILDENICLKNKDKELIVENVLLCD